MNGFALSRRGFMAGLAGTALVPAMGRATEGTPPASPDACVPVEDGNGCLPLAPNADRIDLGPATFTDPTAITNPLLPIRDLVHAIQLGEEGGESLRVEVTLLPETKAVAWNGQPVECLASQYIAWSAGLIVEIAIDYYARDDLGNVWYFGEDVSNYEDGVVANAEGTWLAGKDGPPGMIMPANPRVGDVYRPENIPGFVFEQVTVQAIDQAVDGPAGPVAGAIFIEELLADGTYEHKVFAPGYGEFQAEAPDELVTIAIGVPIDARKEPAPAALGTLLEGIRQCSVTIADGDWAGAAAARDGLDRDWAAVQAAGMPLLLDEQMRASLDRLGGGIEREESVVAWPAALDAERAALDCWLLYAPVVDVDLGRMLTWTRQVELSGSLDDAAGVRGAVVTLEAIWARSGQMVETTAVAEIEASLADLRAAAEAQNQAEAAIAAASLHDLLAGIAPALE
jgi:hypothetical protein